MIQTLRTHGRSQVHFQKTKRWKRTLCRSNCNWQHVHKLQNFTNVRKNVAIRSKCKSARNNVFHFRTDTWYLISQNSQRIKQPWGIQIVTKMCFHGLQVFCDHAHSVCRRNQQFLSFCVKIKNFLSEFLLYFTIDAVGNVDVYQKIRIFQGTECTWPWARLPFFRSTRSRNTGIR